MGAAMSKKLSKNPTKNISHAIAKRLRTIREKHGWLQDDLAMRARNQGLDWSQATVAAIERGSRELSIGEYLMLKAVLWPSRRDGETFLPIEYQDLTDFTQENFADEPIRLAPGLVLKANSIRSFHSHKKPNPIRVLDREKVIARVEESALAERKAAQKLNVSPREIAEAADTIWKGRSLTQERDRRLREEVGKEEIEVDPERKKKRKQALRGWITRVLLVELREELKNQKKGG
jgi:hypothetical protein